MKKSKFITFLVAATLSVSLFSLASALETPIVSSMPTQITPIDTVDTTPSSCLQLTVNMVSGSKDSTTNGQVSDLQFFLSNKGYLRTDPTGYFGVATLAAVKALQSDNGITPNGVVGPLTRAKIAAISCSGDEPGPTEINPQNTWSPHGNANGPRISLSFTGASGNGSSVLVSSGGTVTGINPMTTRTWSWSSQGASSVSARYTITGANCPIALDSAGLMTQENWQPWVGSSSSGDRFNGSNSRQLGSNYYGCTITATYTGRNTQGGTNSSTVRVSFMDSPTSVVTNPNPTYNCNGVVSSSPCSSTSPAIASCLYAAPQPGCGYIQGPYYNPATNCGLVQVCSASSTLGGIDNTLYVCGGIVSHEPCGVITNFTATAGAGSNMVIIGWNSSNTVASDGMRVVCTNNGLTSINLGSPTLLNVNGTREIQLSPNFAGINACKAEIVRNGTVIASNTTSFVVSAQGTIIESVTPTISSFSFTPSTVSTTGTSVATWQTTNASSVRISCTGPGALAWSGSTNLSANGTKTVSGGTGYIGTTSCVITPVNSSGVTGTTRTFTWTVTSGTGSTGGVPLLTTNTATTSNPNGINITAFTVSTSVAPGGQLSLNWTSAANYGYTNYSIEVFCEGDMGNAVVAQSIFVNNLQPSGTRQVTVPTNAHGIHTCRIYPVQNGLAISNIGTVRVFQVNQSVCPSGYTPLSSSYGTSCVPTSGGTGSTGGTTTGTGSGSGTGTTGGSGSSGPAATGISCYQDNLYNNGTLSVTCPKAPNGGIACQVFPSDSSKTGCAGDGYVWVNGNRFQWRGNTSGACYANSSCETNYVCGTVSKRCEPKVEYSYDYGVTGAPSESGVYKRTWGGTAWGPWVFIECRSGFHAEGSAQNCVSNVRTCTIAGGTGRQTYSIGSSSWGSCVVDTCAEGNVLVFGTCKPAKKSCTPINPYPTTYPRGSSVATGYQSIVTPITTDIERYLYDSVCQIECKPGYTKETVQASTLGLDYFQLSSDTTSSALEYCVPSYDKLVSGDLTIPPIVTTDYKVSWSTDTGGISKTVSCKVQPGKSTCDLTASWSSTNAVSGSLTRNGASVGTGGTSGSYRFTIQPTTTDTLVLTLQPGNVRRTNIVVAECETGIWNGEVCTTGGGSSGGIASGSITGGRCTVSIGMSSCATSVSWTSSNAHTVSVTKFNNPGSSLLSNEKNGATTITGLTPSDSGKFVRLQVEPGPTGPVRYSVDLIAECATGSTWNLSTCAPTTGGGGSGSGGTVTPTASISATPSSATYPTTVRYSLSSSNASSCRVTGSDGRTYVSPSENVTSKTLSSLTTPGTLTLTAICYSGTNGSGTASAPSNTSVTVSCPTGQTWNETACVSAATTATLNVSYSYLPSSGGSSKKCIIPIGQRTCSVILEWTTTNASQVTLDGVVSPNNSGFSFGLIPTFPQTFTLVAQPGNVTRTDTVSAECQSGSSYVGSTCVATTGGGGGTVTASCSASMRSSDFFQTAESWANITSSGIDRVEQSTSKDGGTAGPWLAFTTNNGRQTFPPMYFAPGSYRAQIRGIPSGGGAPISCSPSSVSFTVRP